MVSRMKVLFAGMTLLLGAMVSSNLTVGDHRGAASGSGLVEVTYVGDKAEDVKKGGENGRAGGEESSDGSHLGILAIEVGLLAVMVAITVFLLTYGFSTKRALEKAMKWEMASISASVREHFENELHRCDRKASESAQKAYESAMRAIQAFFTFVDVGGARGASEELNEMKRRVMVTGSLLQIEFGESEEVIAGANNVCQLAPIAARTALAEGLKRRGLSEEARETLEARLRELVKEGVEGGDDAGFVGQGGA